MGFSKIDRGPNFASGPSSCCSSRAQIEPGRGLKRLEKAKCDATKIKPAVLIGNQKVRIRDLGERPGAPGRHAGGTHPPLVPAAAGEDSWCTALVGRKQTSTLLLVWLESLHGTLRSTDTPTHVLFLFGGVSSVRRYFYQVLDPNNGCDRCNLVAVARLRVSIVDEHERDAGNSHSRQADPPITRNPQRVRLTVGHSAVAKLELPVLPHSQHVPIGRENRQTRSFEGKWLRVGGAPITI